MKDIYTFKHVGTDDNGNMYASTKTVRVLEEEIDIYAVASAISDFLVGCGFLQTSIDKIIKFDE